MKRLLISAVVIVTMAAATMARDRVGLVFVGNSITQGALHETPAQTAPPVVTAHIVSDSLGYDVAYRNCGVSGTTTVDFLPATNTMFNKVTEAADQLVADGCRLIFSISLGTNDSAGSRALGAPVLPQQYYTNMMVIIDELVARYPDSRVVIQYPIWYSPNTYNGAMYLQAGLDRLQSYMPEIGRLFESYTVKRPGTVSVGSRDGFELFKQEHQTLMVSERGNAGIFYLHPNEQGAVRLAEVWSQGIIDATRR